MTTLLSKPVETAGPGRIVGLGAIGLAILAVLGLVWWTFSPIVGHIYAIVRLIESVYLWKFTGWGSYFTGMPAGQPFAFVSIYKSSVPFGLAAAAFTALLGVLAWRKRSRKHIEILIGSPAGDLFQRDILGAYAPSHCLVRAPAEGPVALETGAVTEAGAEAANEAGEPALAVTNNPFKALRDLRDPRAVEAVADAVPWHCAAALFLTLDAALPLKDRKARDAVLTAAWTGSDHFAADPLAEPPAALLAELRSHMVWAICDMTGRPVDGLNRIHAMLGGQASLKDVIAAVGSLAPAERRLFFPDFAWLRYVDPLLQAAITSH